MIKLVKNFTLTLLMLISGLFNISSANAQGELNLYNWGDYINPAVLEKFEAETGIKVNLDVYGSNEEMLAKIQAGASGYDLVFPSVHFHDILFKLDLLHESKINESANFSNIDKDFISSLNLNLSDTGSDLETQLDIQMMSQTFENVQVVLSVFNAGKFLSSGAESVNQGTLFPGNTVKFEVFADTYDAPTKCDLVFQVAVGDFLTVQYE